MTNTTLLELLFLIVAVAAFFAGLFARKIMRGVDNWSRRRDDNRRRNLPPVTVLNGFGRTLHQRRQRIEIIDISDRSAQS